MSQRALPTHAVTLLHDRKDKLTYLPAKAGSLTPTADPRSSVNVHHILLLST